jgi:hypothetical protein
MPFSLIVQYIPNIVSKITAQNMHNNSGIIGVKKLDNIIRNGVKNFKRFWGYFYVGLYSIPTIV